MTGPSIFPLRELMLICNGCGSERQVPEHVLATIKSVDELNRFLKSVDGIGQWACRCGKPPGTCDIRMLVSEEAEPVIKAEAEAQKANKRTP